MYRIIIIIVFVLFISLIISLLSYTEDFTNTDLVDIKNIFRANVEIIFDDTRKPKTVNSTKRYGSNILNSNTINSNDINSNNIINYNNITSDSIISNQNIVKNIITTNIQAGDIRCDNLINKSAEIAKITANDLLVSNITIRADDGKFYKLYIEDNQLKIKS